MTAVLTTRTRYVLAGVLRAGTGLHVGAGTGIPGIDLVLQTDGLRRPVITGTSLAGVLRSVTYRALVSAGEGNDRAREALDSLWGDQNLASHIVVDDAPMTAGNVRQVRDGVGIGRRSGVAEPGVLYSREVVVPGSCFEFQLEVLAPEPPGEGDALPGSGRWLALVCARALIAGIRVGAATTRGLGLIRLEDATLTSTRDLATPAGVLEALSGSAIPVEIGEPGPMPGVLRVRVDWAPSGTLMCGVAVDGPVDVVPQTTHVRSGGAEDPQVRLLLPGSSLKGALRARAEVIARTVLSADESRPHRSPETLLATCRDETLPGVTALFGSPARRRTDGVKGNTGRRGAVHIDDVLSESVIEGSDWAELMTELVKLPRSARAGDEDERKAKQRLTFREVLGRLNSAVQGNGLKFAVVDHVAIDRWTGGAASNRLFAAVEPTTCTWAPITLEVDLTRFEDREETSAIAVLLLVLRDLADGWVPLGRGTRRGWGDVKVESIQVEVGATSPWAWLAGDLLRPSQTQVDHLDQLIGDWFTRAVDMSTGEGTAS